MRRFARLSSPCRAPRSCRRYGEPDPPHVAACRHPCSLDIDTRRSPPPVPANVAFPTHSRIRARVDHRASRQVASCDRQGVPWSAIGGALGMLLLDSWSECISTLALPSTVTVVVPRVTDKGLSMGQVQSPNSGGRLMVFCSLLPLLLLSPIEEVLYIDIGVIVCSNMYIIKYTIQDIVGYG